MLEEPQLSHGAGTVQWITLNGKLGPNQAAQGGPWSPREGAAVGFSFQKPAKGLEPL